MTSTTTPLPSELSQRFPVSVIAEAAVNDAVARSAKAIADVLEADSLPIIMASSLDDGEMAISSDPAYSCIILAWGLCKTAPEKALKVIGLARRRTAGLPILLSMSRVHSSRVPLEFIENIDGFIRLPEDSPEFIAGGSGRLHNGTWIVLCRLSSGPWSTLPTRMNTPGTPPATPAARHS